MFWMGRLNWTKLNNSIEVIYEGGGGSVNCAIVITVGWRLYPSPFGSTQLLTLLPEFEITVRLWRVSLCKPKGSACLLNLQYIYLYIISNMLHLILKHIFWYVGSELVFLSGQKMLFYFKHSPDRILIVIICFYSFSRRFKL